MTKPKKLYTIDEDAGVLDEVQGWFLALADNEGWVYTSALRQLVNRMYRDRDYQEKRSRQGRHTAYDYALDRDQKALAWAIRALVLYLPPNEKERPEPPKKPRPPARRLSPAQRKATAGRPSWNYRPKRDWEGPELPTQRRSAVRYSSSGVMAPLVEEGNGRVWGAVEGGTKSSNATSASTDSGAPAGPDAINAEDTAD